MARLKGHYAIVTLGEARDRRMIAIETFSSNGNEVQRRFILGVGQRTYQSYIHVCVMSIFYSFFTLDNHVSHAPNLLGRR